MSDPGNTGRARMAVMALSAALATFVPTARGSASPNSAVARPAGLYSPAPFHGAPSPRGVLRIWGPKAMSAVVRSWARGFHRLYPTIRIRARLMGSDTAIPGLYSGRADIALMGRRDDVTDVNGFSRPKGYRFKRLRIMNGSVDTAGESPALAILVSAANPVSHLTLRQLAAIAGCGCARHAPGPIGTWGQLGAHGGWASRPVHLYMIDAASHTGQFLLRVVLDGSRALDWNRVRDFHDLRHADGTVQSAAAQTAAAVRHDPDGIAVSTVTHSGRGLKLVPLAAQAGGPFVVPDRATLVEGAYPLERGAYAFIDRPPGRPLARKVGAFLSYVLSTQGQVAARAGGYLPLDQSALSEARRRLEAWRLAGAVNMPAGYVRQEESLPRYVPGRQLSGNVRLWGSPADGPLIRALAKRFQRFQPLVRFHITLHGPESTFAGVYMDVADLAFMAREIRVPMEMMAFEWVHHYPPLTVEIANDGLTARSAAMRPGVNLAFFVNRANPISCLTLTQLDDVFGADPRRGGRNVRLWGQLGSREVWAGRPIHVYGPPLTNIASVFIRHSLLEGSYKWNPGYRAVAGGWGRLLAALARDPDGITFAPLLPGNPALKALRVAASSGSSCVPLDARTAQMRTYPLARSIDVALDRRPGTPVKPDVKAFLRFILSREGQGIIARDGTYLPLRAQTLRQQLRRLQ